MCTSLGSLIYISFDSSSSLKTARNLAIYYFANTRRFSLRPINSYYPTDYVFAI